MHSTLGVFHLEVSKESIHFPNGTKLFKLEREVFDILRFLLRFVPLFSVELLVKCQIANKYC